MNTHSNIPSSLTRLPALSATSRLLAFGLSLVLTVAMLIAVGALATVEPAQPLMAEATHAHG